MLSQNEISSDLNTLELLVIIGCVYCMISFYELSLSNRSSRQNIGGARLVAGTSPNNAHHAWRVRWAVCPLGEGFLVLSGPTICDVMAPMLGS